MTVRRGVLIFTALAVAGLTLTLVLVGHAQANWIATLVAGVAGVAAVGVSIWAALRQPSLPKPDEQSGGVSNQVTGSVKGQVVQARDVQGGIRFDRSG
jgi:hypothetical protein